MKRTPMGVVMVMVMVLGMTKQGQAATITFLVENLPDVSSPAGDLWQYTYSVTGLPATTGDVQILFDQNLYRDLSTVPSVGPGPDWDTLVFEPSIPLSSPGAFDMLPLGAPISSLVTGPFMVRFIWLGAGSPGSQPFLVFDDRFNQIERGNTTPTPVPEPSTLAMLVSGAMLMGRRFRRRGA